MKSMYPKIDRKKWKFSLLLVALGLWGCAYNLGAPDRTLPMGYKQITIPIFKNRTPEPGIETSFTNALITEFERSRIARVSVPEVSEALVEGEIIELKYISGAPSTRDLPTGAVLASEFRILMKAKVTLKRKSDLVTLWSQEFSGERTYVAPQVTAAGLNTVNPLYNLSARRQNIDAMALEMMSEAHDRLTENF
ncbi:MAG: LptE family protein [Pseudobdellovibrionaceae bacterium]